MGTKSVRHIVEDNLQAYLNNNANMPTVTFVTGDSNNTPTLPKVIVLCDSARLPYDVPQGLGNYNCSVRITIFDSADDTTLEEHRARCAILAGLMQDVSAIKDRFIFTNDARCYDVTPQSENEGVNERSWASVFAYDVLVVVNPQ